MLLKYPTFWEGDVPRWFLDWGDASLRPPAFGAHDCVGIPTDAETHVDLSDKSLRCHILNLSNIIE